MIIVVVIVMIELKTYFVFQSTQALSLQKGSKGWDHFQHCISVTFLQELKTTESLMVVTSRSEADYLTDNSISKNHFRILSSLPGQPYLSELPEHQYFVLIQDRIQKDSNPNSLDITRLQLEIYRAFCNVLRDNEHL